MQIVVDIPDEFTKHYLDGYFVKSLKKIKCDINNFEFFQSGLDIFSSNIEYEFLDMLIKSFSNSSVVDKGVSTFNEREHYKKAFDSVDDKYHDHMLSCLKIFYSNDCNIDSVKDYLLTMFKCGLINCFDLGHIFFVFIFTLYFKDNELDELLADLKKQMNKKEWF